MKRGEQLGVWRPYHRAMNYVTRWVRAGIALVIISVLGWLGGCSDNPHEPVLVDSPPEGLIVSDPVLGAGGAGGASVASGTVAGAVRASSAEDGVAYVSLPPGTVPSGIRAIVRRVGDADSLTTAVLDGGFDPVPVGAQVGDSIVVIVRDAAGGAVFEARLAVAARRPPIVVRTDPPRRKTDVPLNSAIVIVFSEPIDPATLTGSAVQLRRGLTSVAGRLEFRDPNNLMAAFIPAALLTASTSYTLVVTSAIRDLDGEALEAPVTVEFTTATPSPPSTAGLSQIAFWGGGIRVMNADGSNVRTLTIVATDYDPAWSPDRSKLAFASSRASGGSGWDIYVMNVDGSGIRRLTNTSSQNHAPAWSPDGTRIAFLRDGDIYVMNAADGSAETKLARGGCCSDDGLTWSPDGSKIAFDRDDGPNAHIYVMNADGSGITQLTSDPSHDGDPAWSPDGTRIVFTRREEYGWAIYVVNASDGSGVTRLTGVGEGFGGPAWSPDSRMITFGGYGGIAIMNVDGSGVRQLAGGTSPAWSLVGSMPPVPSLSIQKVGGDRQTDTVLATLAEPLRVLVLRDNAPAPGVAVSWTLDGDVGSLSARTSTDASGIASVTLTLGSRLGVYGALASAPGASGLPVVAFTATASPGAPVTLCCDYQFGAGLVNETLEYQVQAFDGHTRELNGRLLGNMVSGVPITWAVTAGGGSITPAQDTTASPPCCYYPYSSAVHTLGPSDGTAVVTATAPTMPGAPQVTFVTRAVTVVVHMPDYAGDPFGPASVDVPSGRTVAWLWRYNSEDSPEHNVTFEDDPTQPTSSPTQGHHGDPFTRTFGGAPRTIRYRCTLHSTSFTDSAGEVGTVTVEP